MATTVTSTVDLGRRYRDIYSGWAGTATALYVYVNGCVRVELSAADKDGKPEQFVFDEQQLEAVPAPPIEQPSRPTGGPQSTRPVPR